MNKEIVKYDESMNKYWREYKYFIRFWQFFLDFHRLWKFIRKSLPAVENGAPNLHFY